MPPHPLFPPGFPPRPLNTNLDKFSRSFVPPIPNFLGDRARFLDRVGEDVHINGDGSLVVIREIKQGGRGFISLRGAGEEEK